MWRLLCSRREKNLEDILCVLWSGEAEPARFQNTKSINHEINLLNYSTKWRIISTKIQLRAPASCHRLPSSLIEQEITLKNKIYKVFGKIVRIKNMFVKTHPITCFCDISEPKQKFSKVGLFLKWKTQPGKK